MARLLDYDFDFSVIRGSCSSESSPRSKAPVILDMKDEGFIFMEQI